MAGYATYIKGTFNDKLKCTHEVSQLLPFKYVAFKADRRVTTDLLKSHASTCFRALGAKPPEFERNAEFIYMCIYIYIYL